MFTGARFKDLTGGPVALARCFASADPSTRCEIADVRSVPVPMLCVVYGVHRALLRK
jgi:hypothetical protein